MTTHQIIDIDNARSYANEENLNGALTKLGLGEIERITVRNRTGRWTAIFTVSRLEAKNINLGWPASIGFPVVN